MNAKGPVDCGSGNFVSEKVDGEGEKGSRDTTIVNAKNFLEIYLDMSLRSASTTEVLGFPEYQLSG
jgi:hypothetical protein